MTAGITRPEPARAGHSSRMTAGLIACLVLAAGLTAGLLRQGAFFAAGQWSMGLLVAGTLVVALADHPLSWDDIRCTPVLFLLGIGGWALLDGALHGAVRDGLPTAWLAVGVIAVLVVCRRLTGPHRRVLLGGVITAAVVVAAAGWVGVAFRSTPWGLDAQHLWRASSTLTYPNAAAAVLAPTSLLAVAALTRRPRSPWLGLATTGLLVGLGATLSRAGLLSLVVGAVVLAILLGVPAVLRAGCAPVLGATVALAGLVPSIPTSAPRSVAPATATLLVGLALGASAGRLTTRWRLALLLCVGLSTTLTGLVLGRIGRAAATIAGTRATASSPDRAHGLHAAASVFASHPLTGAGPGLARLHWIGPDGLGGTLRYAHNEYVQVAADLGLVGGALLVGLLLATALLLRRARGWGAPPAVWAGAVSAAVAFAVHSSFDFLWHIPAIPMTVAALVGLVTPVAVHEQPASAEETHPLQREETR